MTNNTANIGFEKEIWDAACILRGNLDASEYKRGTGGSPWEAAARFAR